MGYAFHAVKGEPPFDADELKKQELALEEFKELCRPVVEYIQKKWHPHTWILIEYDRATLTEDYFGVPFQVPD